MLTPATVDATARECLEMHRTRARYRPLAASVRAAPLDDAYRIQDALHRLIAEAGRGDIAGWKIALTSKAIGDPDQSPVEIRRAVDFALERIEGEHHAQEKMNP